MFTVDHVRTPQTQYVLRDLRPMRLRYCRRRRTVSPWDGFIRAPSSTSASATSRYRDRHQNSRNTNFDRERNLIPHVEHMMGRRALRIRAYPSRIQRYIRRCSYLVYMPRGYEHHAVGVFSGILGSQYASNQNYALFAMHPNAWHLVNIGEDHDCQKASQLYQRNTLQESRMQRLLR